VSWTRCARVALLSTLLVLVAACGGTEVAAGRPGTSDAPVAGTARGSAPAPSVTAADTTPASSTTTAPAPTTVLPVKGAAPSTAAPTTVPTTPATSPAPVNHAVATTDLVLSDSSRATVSRGRTISGTRALPTTVFYPSDAVGPYPVVVFAHGFQIGPRPYARLCEKLAAAGYVVAAPSFPLTDQNAAGGNLDRGDLPNQADDVAFVVSNVITAGAGSGPLSRRVDGTRVGIVGHSDGADTALDVGYYPGRTDPRVRAVVALAPDAMTGPGGSVGAGTPLLLEHGDRDSIVPLSNSRTVFGQVDAHRLFLVLTGADHLPPVQGAAPWAPVLEGVVVAFLDRYVAGRTSTDDGIVERGRRPGVATIETAG
jgi:predicted dienelactone hydrolase